MINYYDLLKEKVAEEFEIEIQDKINLINEGVDVSSFYEDEFNILRKLLYKDVKYYNFFHKIDVFRARHILTYIDDKVIESIDYVTYYINKRKEEGNEDRFRNFT